MNRRSRTVQELEGDRSHIPREERSYVEYHPTLLTHLALTLVHQATSHIKRAHSRGPSGSLTNGRRSLSSVSDTLRETQPTSATPAASVASNDLPESQCDDMYAIGQITNGLHTTNTETFGESAANLFEIDPTLANLQTTDVPLLPTHLPTQNSQEHLPDNNVAQHQNLNGAHELCLNYPGGTSGKHDQSVATTPRLQQSRGSQVIASDRFLRSEVSVEEKYERLRREEGFAIGKLHEPRFRRLETPISEHKVKLTGNAIAFGYQADRPFKRPEQAYIRTVDQPESELADRVEYDMDEQDDHWLTLYNARKSLRDGDTVSREIFEITLTKIEKEWTALEKRIPKPVKHDDGTSEDAKCAICDDGECENTNAIVFCDGCNLAVHQGEHFLS